MGFIIIEHPDGKTEILGDEEQAKKSLGMPHKNDKGRYVSQPELDEIDKMGE